MKHGVPRTTLQRARNSSATPEAVLQLSAGRGRKKRLSGIEESLIAQTIVELQNRNSPLTRDLVLDVVQTYIATLPELRKKQISFPNNRPGSQGFEIFYCVTQC